MYKSYSKSFALATLALVSVHQSESFSCPFDAELKAVGAEQLTVGGLFRDHVVHQVARDWAKKNLPESEVFSFGSAKLNASEVWETIASMVVEAFYASLNDKPGETPLLAAKFVAYGAVLHKVAAEVWQTLGLNAYFSEEAKTNYDKFGRCYMQAVLAKKFQSTFKDFGV